MLESLSWKNKMVTKNEEAEKMVGFAKTFEYYHHKFPALQ